jgi:hypothetical protein
MGDFHITNDTVAVDKYLSFISQNSTLSCYVFWLPTYLLNFFTLSDSFTSVMGPIRKIGNTTKKKRSPLHFELENQSQYDKVLPDCIKEGFFKCQNL